MKRADLVCRGFLRENEIKGGNVCNSGPPVPEAGWSIIEEPAISFPLWGNDLRLAKPLERTFWLWKGRLRVRPGEAGTGNEKTDALHEKGEEIMIFWHSPTEGTSVVILRTVTQPEARRLREKILARTKFSKAAKEYERHQMLHLTPRVVLLTSPRSAWAAREAPLAPHAILSMMQDERTASQQGAEVKDDCVNTHPGDPHRP